MLRRGLRHGVQIFESGRLPTENPTSVLSVGNGTVKRQIHVRNGTLHVQDSNGNLAELTTPNGPLCADQVRCRGFLHGLFGFQVLEVVYDDGAPAVWFFDDNLRCIARAIEELDPSARKIYDAAVVELHDRLWSDALLARSPSEESSAFLDLDFWSRAVIWREDCPTPFLTPTYVYLRDEAVDGNPIGDLRRYLAERGVSYDDAMDLIDTGFTEVVRQARATGRLSVRSPFSGTLCTTDISLCASEIHYWYAFDDRAAGIRFYAIAGGHHCRVLGIYEPRSQILMMHSLHMRSIAEAHQRNTLDKVLLRHIVHFGDRLFPYLAASCRKLSLLCYEAHLAHHVWNELSGLDAVFSEPDPPSIDCIYQICSTSEMFGLIEELFPNTLGHVERRFGDRTALIREFYEDLRFLVRPTSIVSTPSLRRRLVERAESQAYIAAERDEVASHRDAGRPIIAFCLRVENRTVVDAIAFFERCARQILDRIGPCCFVVDGRVRSLRDTFAPASVGEGDSTDALLAAETAIDDGLVRALADRDCQVVINIDKPVGVNIFWLSRTAFFIGMWGTGLVRSRWIANCPGIMLSNTWNLKNHWDIDLFGSDRWMDEPTPLISVPPSVIRDRPDVRQACPIRGRMGDNFEVDADRFRLVLHGAIERFLPGSIPTLR